MLFTAGIIVFTLIRIIFQKKIYKWPIKYLQYILPIISFGFYGQIFLLFTTAFYCKKEESPTSPYLKCRDSWFNNFKFLVGLAAFLHFIIALVTNTLYYHPTFIKCKTDLLQKTNSFPDVVFLIVKILVISLFSLDKGVESEHWTIIIFLIFITGINTYYTLFYQNRKNDILLNLNNIFCLILFTGYLILLIGKAVKYWNFNGSIFLLASLVIIIFIFFIFHKSYNPNFIMKDYRNIHHPDEYLQYVLKFSDFVRNKNKSRDNLIVMSGLISSMEKNCLDPECPLKKYVINLKKGIDSEYYLLQFVEILYQYGIAKFPANIFLKNYYSSFLIMEMNNKKKAIIVNNDIKDKILTLQMNYSIYRCQKIIENYSSPFINKNNSIFNYRKDVQDFRNNIENMSLLYYEFLSLLLGRKMENVANFEKINQIGYDIKKLLKKTEVSFEKLINIKIDNYEIIKLYSEFVENILNDEDKIEKCKNYLKIKNSNTITEIQEKDYSNFNLEILKESDNFFYLIILTRKKDLGIISDCSKNLCNLLGYTKNELLGKHINFLIPKVFHKKHKELIKQKSEDHKLIFFENKYKNTIYFPDVMERDIYCISKAKLLIPLMAKIYLVNNEENELVYIAEFTRRYSVGNDLLKKINNNTDEPEYCVLTDKNFVIQSFTANCLNFLKFKYEDIGANYNILNFIKQFRQDYFAALNASSVNKYSHMANTEFIAFRESNNESKTGFINNNNAKAKNAIADIKKKKLKKELFNKKFHKKCKITWSHCVDDMVNSTKVMQKYYHLRSSLIRNDSIISLDNFKILNIYEKELYMETKKIILGQELIGYYFYFSNLYTPKPNSFFNYKIENRETHLEKRTEGIKKSKKYQVIIKSPNSIKKQEDTIFKKLEYSFPRNNNEKNDFSKIRDVRKSLDANKISNRHRKSSKTYIRKETHEVSLEKTHEDDIIVNGDFVPENKFCLDFDHVNCSYISSTIPKNDKLSEIQKDAEEKLNKIIKIKFEKKLIVNRLFNGSDSEEEDEDNKEDYYVSSSMYSSTSILGSDKFSPRSKTISKQNSAEKKNRNDRKLQNVKMHKQLDDIGNLFVGRNKSQIKKILKRASEGVKDFDIHQYHKVDLRKIKYLEYNYHKEMFEEKLHSNLSEVENIIYNFRRGFRHDIGRDDDYPNVTIKNQNKEVKEENEKTEIKKNSDIFKIMDKDKILKRKIIGAINNYKDEEPVQKLKILSVILFFIMFGFGLFNYFINDKYFHTFQDLIKLLQSALGLKYCNIVSVFYIRELTLLNFNLSEIKGGIYTNIPANDRANYTAYLSKKLIQLYINNHNLVKTILGTAYPFSQNSLSKLSEESFMFRFLTPENKIRSVKYDMKKIIIAYNTAFSNLASSNINLEQNHSDLINYIENTFADFAKGFDTYYDIFFYELELLKKKIKLYIYLINSFILIIDLLFYFCGLKFFLSSNIIRINYIKIFYNINSGTLKDLIKNCLNLIDKFKSNQTMETSGSEEEVKENISNLNKIKFIEVNDNNPDQVEMSTKYRNIYLSYLSLFFITFYFIFLGFIFSYFVYISVYFYEIYKKSIQISVFSKHFSIFQFCPMQIYNSYREYIFDNISLINDTSPYEYLRYGETNIYNLLHISKTYLNNHVGDLNLLDQNHIYEIYHKNSCSYEVNDYFNIKEECVNKFDYFSRLNLIESVFYFLEELRIKKNLIKYMLDKYYVVGDLTKYNQEDMINVYKENSNRNDTIFRLDLFNNEKIHTRINFFYFSILLQNIEEGSIIINYLTINGMDSRFILLIIFYTFALFFVILLFFIPVIKFLNEQIFKAKNILSIVPVNVLLYQRNDSNLFKFFKD